jgi:uncharacterized phage protein (TIGR01671 family)
MGDVLQMRELKFRAYNKTLKKMIYNDEFHALYAYFNFIEDMKEMNKFSDHMQYTGLKDKDDNLIYEGDIVKNKYSEILQVKFGFHDTNLGHFYSSRAYGFYLSNLNQELETLEESFIESDKDEIEIIGNVWESPELLEPKQ